MNLWTSRSNAGTTSTLSSFVAGCVSGLTFGLVLGILYAPHRGRVTRKKIRRRIDDGRDQAEAALEELASRTER